MPSTPLIASSMGVATVSAITLGLAPGYCARTTTDGGTTSGYSETGITRRASRPDRKISTDSTPAKIGRSMTNLDRFMALEVSAPPDLTPWHHPRSHHGVGPAASDTGSALHCLRLRLRSTSHGDDLRRQHRARPHPLQAVDDDPLALGKPAPDDAQPVGDGTEGDLAVGGLALVVHDQDELPALVGTDGALIDSHHRDRLAGAHAQARELAGDQARIRVGEDGAHAHGAGAGIDLIVDQLQLAADRLAVLRRRRHDDGDLADL